MSFDRAYEFTRQQEGGWADDRHDKGGRTRYGISSRAHPNVDLDTLTPQGAKDIYQKDYWRGSGCNELPWPISLVVFDAAVHSGRTRAVQWLQAAVGSKRDGVVGSMTIQCMEAAVEAHGAPSVALDVLHERRKYMVEGFRNGYFSKNEPLWFLSGFWKRTVDLAFEVGRG